MKTQIINYTFDASEKKITFTDYATIRLDSVLLITNVTDNIIIYNFADATKGGAVTDNILTLAYNTATMDDADKLMVYYDDATSSQTVSGTVTVSNPTTNPETGLAKSVKQDSQITLETTLNSLIETLQELTQRLAPLAGSMTNVGGQSLRITGVGGTMTASGPITSAQSIAEKAIGGVSYDQRVAAENLTAIQSNLNNITAN
jgi:hypothetical protein